MLLSNRPPSAMSDHLDSVMSIILTFFTDRLRWKSYKGRQTLGYLSSQPSKRLLVVT
jgi:hypothetical protein